MMLATKRFLCCGRGSFLRPRGFWFAPTTREFSLCINLEELEDPSIESFSERLIDKEDGAIAPLKLKLSCIKEWPALSVPEKRWDDFAQLKNRILEDKLVPLEIGQSYMDPSIQKARVPLKLYLDYLITAKEEFQAQEDNAQERISAQSSQELAYLAQHRLFEEVPELAADISTPYLCRHTGRGDSYGTNAWFGPHGTVSPMHTDPYHNILVQVVGRKYIRLYSPDDSNAIPRSADPRQQNTCSVFDLEEPTASAALQGLRYYEVILEPGEALFIPRKWWHYCRSKTVSCSVNFWWL